MFRKKIPFGRIIPPFFFESSESDRFFFNYLHDSNSIFRAAELTQNGFRDRTVHFWTQDEPAEDVLVSLFVCYPQVFSSIASGSFMVIFLRPVVAQINKRWRKPSTRVSGVLRPHIYARGSKMLRSCRARSSRKRSCQWSVLWFQAG